MIDYIKNSHTARFTDPTGCGKNHFVVDLIEKKYSKHFDYIIIICPTLQWSKTYHAAGCVGVNLEFLCVAGFYIFVTNSIYGQHNIKRNQVLKFYFEQKFVNRCTLCLQALTRVFGLENSRSVSTGKTCTNSQNSIKIVTTINNKLQEKEDSKLKRRSADLKRRSNLKSRKYYKIRFHLRYTLGVTTLKVTCRNTGGPCLDVAPCEVLH